MTTIPTTIQERVPMPGAMIRRPATSAAAAAGLSAADILRILKQRIFLVLFVWLFVSAATAALTLYLQKYYGEYQANALIEVMSQGVRDPLRLDNPAYAVDTMNRWLADQVQYIQQDRVLDEAFKSQSIRETGWYRTWMSKYQDNEAVFEELKDNLSVVPIPNTSYLRVSFPAANREDAEVIVNTIVDKYVDKLKTDSTTELGKQLADFNKQLTDLGKALNQARDEKEAYIGGMINTPGVAYGIYVPAEQWRALATEATRLEAEQLQYKAAWDNLQKLDPQQIALSPAYKINIQQDPSVMMLNNALMVLQQDYHSALGRVGPQHRTVKTLAAQIQAAQKQRDEVTREKEEEIRQFQMVSAETSWLNALQAQQALDERVSEFEAKQHDLDTKMARLASMEDRQEMLKKQYELLSGHVQNLNVLANSQDTVHVRQGKAVVSPKRSFPRWELYMPLGSSLGLVLGIGLALLLELGSSSIRTPRDLMRHVRIPMLGTVPDLDDEEVAIEQMELASHTAPRSMVAEAFRNIRTNLLLSSPAERQRTLLITSPRAEDGKTSVAVNLAIVIGQSGRRVLLVDANFHRPTLHNLFPKAPREGLSNILVGMGDLEQLASSSGLPNVDVLTCGPIPPNPTELLSSRNMSELISKAAQRYDQVLFDGPPILLVSDAAVLASAVDGALVVCRAKSTSRGVVQRAREQLERVNARIFGAVLNAAQMARGGYFREQMRSYYDYQPEETLAAQGGRSLPSANKESGTEPRA